ncbi:response regulator [Microcoleus sp. herbarium19]|uniref:sensor histidine kinase n=1 Tax=unclassified Microcoleus TaxID=2642155 RepID=UPI002FD72E76
MSSNSILIVDDTPNNIRLLFDVLDRAGFDISVVKSGEKALEKLNSIQPDLILLDVMMPGIDGFETCRRIKANPENADIPIIFMTALSETQNKVVGLQLGAVDYITKPIQVEEVLARVNTHLGLRNTQRQLHREIADRILAEVELKQTLTALQQMQMQLVQNEKMSALGNLVAGVAHEINNPIGFLNGSIHNTKEHIQDLIRHLSLYQQSYPSAPAPIQENAADIDLEFLIADLPKLLHSMQGATDRIKGISTSLRTFSRADTEYKVKANIHDGLDSTLLILKYRLKANEHRPEIQVIKDYGDLPQIECFPGQLNQVFMNILANAIDALDEFNIERKLDEIKANPNKIKIKTSLDNNIVKITIADNGKGIVEEIKSQIFEHLFTTKPVGQGTGLGLAIAHQIVAEKHCGTLNVNSQVGKGTVFAIEIPIVAAA